MTGTETFIYISTEDLEQTSGGLAVWEDGYSRWLYYREFAPYMRQGLNSYIDAWKYGFSEQGNLSKKYDEKHKETDTIWNICFYYFTLYLFTTNI